MPDASVADLMAFYGGMGSFNDLVIHRRNGHPIHADQINAVNEKVQTLGFRIRIQAIELSHSSVLSRSARTGNTKTD
ncbi:hypothetical protein [Amycolatopsis sp. NPDC051372]|uniref:DUF6966 domain-containing protein n=1 Tax=Amycolatopsis sp. NPDC051372 TaxID=3155669 RepID=UPI0034221CCF